MLSPETQEDRSRQYCGAQAWTVAALERDIDESGFQKHYAEREGLSRLISLAEQGRLTKLVVWKFSRLSRRLHEFVEICERMEAVGVGVVSVTEQVDTGTPAGRLIRNILASFAQFQSEEIGEQIFETWLTRAKRGERPPGAAPFGTINRRGLLEPDPNTHPHLLAMYQTLGDTGSVRSVWDYLTVQGIPAPKAQSWNLNTIRGILTNPVYVGRMTWAGAEFEGRWPPLVPPELWGQVRDILNGRRSGLTGRRGDRLLTGLIHCGGCGQVMWTRYVRRSEDGSNFVRPVYWCCSHQNLRRGCRVPVLDAEEVEAAVWSATSTLLRQSGIPEVAKSARTRLREGTTATVSPARRSLASEREHVTVAAANLAAVIGEASLEGISPAMQRRILLALGTQIQVQPQRVTLRILGLCLNLQARLVGETWHFGESYQRLDCRASQLTDKQLNFIRRTYRWAPKQAIAARLGRPYATIVGAVRRLRQEEELAEGRGQTKK